MLSTQKTRYLVFGANGQLGRALNRVLENVICLDRENANFLHPETLPDIVRGINPEVIINAAAYTQVDNAEIEQEQAFIINATAVATLAKIANELSIPLIHFSTDYVFDGNGKQAWTENDTPNPLNIYGKSKLSGEQKIISCAGKYLIFRTSWVYDAYGKNFLTTMLKLGKDLEKITVIADQFGAPTHAQQLAESCLIALGNAEKQHIFPSGIYHLCASGETTWHGFAQEIFTQAANKNITFKVKNIEAISTHEYNTAAIRPHNSRLNCQKAKDILGVTLPDWREGVALAIKEIPPWS